MSYRVKTVSQLTGIPRNTLVAWERRYGILGPARSEGGYRLYTDQDVGYLKELRALVDGGLSISEAISRQGLKPAPGREEPSSHGMDPQGLAEELLERLLEFDEDGAASLIRRVSLMPFEDAIEDVWRPLLSRVGENWQAGEISVAQEHYVTGVVREHAQGMFRALERGGGGGPRVALACVAEEQHDLPLMLLAVQLRRRDWRVIWLGASVPTGDLCAFAAAQRPDVICLSATAGREPEAVLDIARQVLGNAPRTSVVAVGGAVLAGTAERGTPRLWVCSSAEELVERWESRVRVVAG